MLGRPFFKYFLCIFLFSLLSLGYGLNLFAQNGQPSKYDFSLWPSLELTYEMNDKWKLLFTEAFRFKDHVTQLDQIYSELSISYEPIKHFELATGTRFMQENKKNGLVHEVRFLADVILSHDVNKFGFQYRLRYLNENELGVSREEDDELIHQLRIKTSIKYNIKNCKVDPKLSAELISKFQKNENPGINKIRVKLDSEYQFKKAGSIGYFVGYERKFQKADARNNFILGLNYTFEIPKKKKKSDE